MVYADDSSSKKASLPGTSPATHSLSKYRGSPQGTSSSFTNQAKAMWCHSPSLKLTALLEAAVFPREDELIFKRPLPVFASAIPSRRSPIVRIK